MAADSTDKSKRTGPACLRACAVGASPHGMAIDGPHKESTGATLWVDRSPASVPAGMCEFVFRLRAVVTLKRYFKPLEYEYRVKTAILDTLKRYSILSLTLYLEWYSAYSILYSTVPTILYRGWMGAGEISIEERILLTRTYRG
jgi:hypothetical protein